MEIEVDYCPTSPRAHYFISVSLNDTEVISFDHTLKGYRVVKQVLIKQNIPSGKNENITGKWKTIVLKDGKFVKIYDVEWINGDNLDTVNGNVWETIWEKELDKNTDKILLYYSRLISDNYKNLNKLSKEMREFEEIMKKEIIKYK